MALPGAGAAPRRDRGALLFFAGVGLLVDGFGDHRARGSTEGLAAARIEQAAPGE